MDWRERIVTDKEILAGKPIIKGTRLSVEFVLGLFASGWSEQQVLNSYPNLHKDDILAAFAFAQEEIQHRLFFETPATK